MQAIPDQHLTCTSAKKIRVNEKIVQKIIGFPDGCKTDGDPGEFRHHDTFLLRVPVEILQLERAWL